MQWTTKEGKVLELHEIGTDHLKNIIRLVLRRSKEGLTVKDGGGSGPEDYWYEEYTVYGEEALKLSHYSELKEELKRRK